VINLSLSTAKNRFGETIKFHYLSSKLKVMKVKVSSTLNDKSLQQVAAAGRKKLAEYKAKGLTKQQCIDLKNALGQAIFPKVFVENNYEAAN